MRDFFMGMIRLYKEVIVKEIYAPYIKTYINEIVFMICKLKLDI